MLIFDVHDVALARLIDPLNQQRAGGLQFHDPASTVKTRMFYARSRMEQFLKLTGVEAL